VEPHPVARSFRGKPLAFVDVETTGLSPVQNRIAEIGVVTVDRGGVDRWTSFLSAPSRKLRDRLRGDPDYMATAPSFGDIAAGLAQRLSGRLLIAHNARFDHAFLNAAFERAGVTFEADVLCTVMLSRKLFPDLPGHNLDSLIERHELQAGVRHRALPDADVVWQWWQLVHRKCGTEVIDDAIASLIAGPVLPSQLDPALVERLPEQPGAYVLHGEAGQPLAAAAAANVRRHVLNYFRLDRASSKALEHAHRVSNITWRVTPGMLGARLHAAALRSDAFARMTRRPVPEAWTWHFVPEAIPCISIAPLAVAPGQKMADSFGVHSSKRRAANALVRLARKHGLCHLLTGLSSLVDAPCPGCPLDDFRHGCARTIDRKKHLVKVFAALDGLRVPAWPHRGPIGVRERSEMHVIDHWQFLGTARCEVDVQELLRSRPCEAGGPPMRMLRRTLARLPRSQVVDLSGCVPGEVASAEAFAAESL